MPKAMQYYPVQGEEVIRIITAPPNADAGQLLLDERISVDSVKRLSVLASVFQRVKWFKAELHLVALNGSTVKSGYNSGFIEDPEIKIPADLSARIPFLTALRGTAVRQNWVETTVGELLQLKDLPEMYTTPGSDPRRYYIGRYVAAYTGPPGDGVVYQLNLRYSVGLSLPVIKDSTTDESTYIMTSDLVNGTPILQNDSTVASELRPLRNDSPAKSVFSLSPLPPTGTWIISSQSFASLKFVKPFTLTLKDNEDAWPMHNAIYNNLATDVIHSIYVPPSALSWADVMYRVRPNGPLHPWPTGRIVTKRRALEPPADFATIDFSYEGETFPYMNTTPPDWAASFETAFPGNWAQAPIIPAGTEMEKSITTTLLDSQTYIDYRLASLRI